jgi:hypothetical protein
MGGELPIMTQGGKNMKDPVDPDELKDLDEKHLDTLEKIIQRELHNVGQARERLEKALADIRREREQRRGG